MIKVGIIGATGYAGNELVRLLMGHKEVEIKWYGSRSYVEQKYASVYQNMFEIVEDTCLDDNIEALAEQVDVIFTATPQGYLAGVLNEEILSKVKIIDLSADFRITSTLPSQTLRTTWKWTAHACLLLRFTPIRARRSSVTGHVPTVVPT